MHIGIALACLGSCTVPLAVTQRLASDGTKMKTKAVVTHQP
jgi:hypothetical protein